MGYGRVSPKAKAKYMRLRHQLGYNRSEACRQTKISLSTGKRFDEDYRSDSQRDRALDNAAENLPGPIPYDQLTERAKRGWDDFEFFRKTYLGHISTPWQVETANLVAGLLTTPEKEFVTENCPPGAGKSTLAVDIALWCIVRNRRIRILFGSRVQSNADRSLKRVKRTFERTSPFRASDEKKALDLECDAEATLAEDYGLFRPVGAETWRGDEFIVAQYDDLLIEEKEPTCSSYGMDSGVLGNRFNLCFWDDVVDKTTIRTMEATEAQREWWDTEAETRLEPGGVLFLIGQRMAANDLYRYNLDKRMPLSEEEAEAAADLPEHERVELENQQKSKYRHVLYLAHYEAQCDPKVTHKRGAPAYPDGCLLDPYRISWRDCYDIMHTKTGTWAVQYQQEDSSGDTTLVKKVWVHGGTCPDEKTLHPGCVDDDRGLCELPPGLKGPKYSFCTVDPSPTKMWAIQWWCVAAGQRVTTLRGGEVPIEQVRASDEVLTRNGWKHVQHVTYMGRKPVVAVGMSNGRTLRVTADHKVLLADGRWVEAGSLTVGSPLCSPTLSGGVGAGAAGRGTVLSDDDVPAGDFVAAGAMGAPVADVRGADHVRPVGDGLKMVWVPAGGIAADVIQLPEDRFATVLQDAESEAVSKSLASAGSDAPVPGLVTRSLPLPAAGGRDYDPSANPRLVHPSLTPVIEHPVPADVAPLRFRAARLPARTTVHVESLSLEPPIDVYDIGVYGLHEFTVEGVLVHNCYTPEASNQLFLLDLLRVRMGGNELLDWNINQGLHSGVMEDWQARSVNLGLPITEWIVEINAAQRFLLQYQFVSHWQQKWNVALRPHSTNLNKLDPKMGVDMVRDWWKFGRIRLPYRPGEARLQSLKLIDEVTKYPKAWTDDQVMAHWFAVTHLPRIAVPMDSGDRLARPSYLSRMPDARRLMAVPG